MKGVDNEYRLCVMGDLNGWIRSRVKDGVAGVFGVASKNEKMEGE